MGKRRRAKAELDALLEEILAGSPDVRKQWERWHPPSSLMRRHYLEYFGFLAVHIAFFAFFLSWVIHWSALGLLLRFGVQLGTQFFGMWWINLVHGRRLREAGYDHMWMARKRRLEKWWENSGRQARWQQRQTVKLLQELTKD